MKITIAGTGYVGLSLATLLAKKHEVIALDIIQEKVDMVNNRISPLKEEYIEKYFKEEELNLIATTNKELAYSSAELIIIATPTNYDEDTHYFDTSSIEDAIENSLKYNPTANIVIKSTIPVGYVNRIRYRYGVDNIYFSPEFLREGLSLKDNLYPSRIVVGDKGEFGKMFSKLLLDSALIDDVPILLTNPTEAEAIKLFANTYLAMRVAYFNELDNYALANALNTKDIIKGICMDPRIGDGYNNPSFGYGGACLPKDSKQLAANFNNYNTPQSLISAIVESNKIRKQFIADEIMRICPKGVIGIYKTAMKFDSDNNRQSAILDIINILKAKDRDILIFEDSNNVSVLNCKVTVNFNYFVKNSAIILTNRRFKELEPYSDKVYTRDIFGIN